MRNFAFLDLRSIKSQIFFKQNNSNTVVLMIILFGKIMEIYCDVIHLSFLIILRSICRKVNRLINFISNSGKTLSNW